MLRSLLAALALAAVVPATAAQEDGGRLAERNVATRGAFERWRDAHDRGWRMQIEERTGRAEFIGGGRVEGSMRPVAEADWFAAARGFVEATLGMTGLEPATLVEERVKLLPLGLAGTTDKWTVRFRQEVGGVPVLGARVNVLLDLDGALLSVQSTALPDVLGVPTSARIDGQEALGAALAAFADETGLPGVATRAPQLGIGALERDRTLVPRLVWEVEVHWRARDSEPEGFVYWVDAEAGEVVRARDAIHHDVGGQVRTWATTNTMPDAAGNTEIQAPMPYARVTSSAGTVFADSQGNFNYPGITGPIDVTVEYLGSWANVDDNSGTDYAFTQSLVSTGNVVLMNPSMPEAVTAQANAYYHVGVLRDWVRAVDPLDDTADFQALARTNLNSTCNAYFDGSSINFFASGGGCVNTAYSTVVVHEMGHWLNVLYGTGNGSDGMGEGNADVFAMYVYDTPIVGDGFLGPGTNIRSGLNGTTFCGDCCPGCHGGQVHREGEVWMGAAWKLRAHLNTTHGNTVGDAIANGLFSAWMNAYDQTQIKSVIETQWLVLDDDNGQIEDGTPHYPDIDQGFRDQGFPGFDLPAIFFPSVTQLPDTMDEAGPYQVDAEVIAQLFPPILQMDLYHRVNGGPWHSVAMIPSGVNGYFEVIPGQISPATVDYYVLASDGIGNVVTYPTEAPDETLQFHVGDLQVLLAADFEGSDDEGWTHGSFGDTPNDHDDFQRGAPAGKGGDPTVAVSGQNVWGNDLGQGAWNGRYQNVQHNWLRSPVIDCSDAVNSELRFWHWLSVEDSLHDRAVVSVNGVELWVNDDMADTFESEWVLESFDVSSIVDGAPAVQIEFSLESDGEVAFGGWNVDDVVLRYLAPSVGGPPGTAYCFGDGTGTPCPCANGGGPDEGCANSTGAGAVLVASGSLSVGADDLGFTASNLLPNQPALLFAGLNAVNGGNGNHFGDGLRCAGGGLARFGVDLPDAGGQASWGPGLGAAGGWSAGDTRRFQTWYRNPGGSPCGANFNLSHGVELSFVP